MTSSRTIAGFIGPTLLAIAVAELVNLGSLPALMEEAARSPLVIFLSGVLLFVAGLAIARAHNVWSGGWPVLVTVLGWLAMLGGLARMFLPTRLAPLLVAIGENATVMVAAAVVTLAIGAFLSFKAYGRG